MGKQLPYSVRPAGGQALLGCGAVVYRGSVLYSGADEETEAGVDVTALNSLAG